MKKIHYLLCALSLILMSAGCEEDKYPELEDGIYAEINTTKGTMVAELYYDEAPATVANYVALAEGEHTELTDSLQGKPYYDGLIFHRVIDGFMIQGGDFTGTGSGRVGYKFPQEVQDSLKHDEKGVMSMANAGPGTNGTQFFIMHKPNPSLDMNYNVFGKVIQGTEVIDSIATVQTDGRDKPLDSVVMNSVRIIRKGNEARKFDAMKVFKEASEGLEKKAEEKRLEEQRIARERAEKSQAFIADKKKELMELKKKAKSIPNSEIKIYVVEKGTGVKPENGAQVQLDYNGYLENGVMFDSSDLELAQNFNAVNPMKERAGAYRPIGVKFTPEMSAVQGFKDAVLSMEYGQEIVAFIPSAVGYGERAMGPIPPNSDLVFEMKMLEPQQ
ncbi:peptidylprolyl isomerase [Nonlabens spongiae]|uniref:peptidylprolyl isomerase n=1 Tax=Nonlabens spongiae TaxID=331648 RepID=A0A1W6MH50_9FLAO|nr:peptidylprolyl isomerase [Nonlabens spongiae]ARN76836.1 peptidylprolyl isomerase [Nonlabens spongiae]